MHEADTGYAELEVVQNKTVHRNVGGRGGAGAIDDVGPDPSLPALQSPSEQGPVTTVSFDAQQRLSTEPCLLPGINDIRMMTWNTNEASLQCQILPGISASQNFRHHGLSFDQQARKWLQDFCDETR